MNIYKLKIRLYWECAQQKCIAGSIIDLIINSSKKNFFFRTVFSHFMVNFPENEINFLHVCIVVASYICITA